MLVCVWKGMLEGLKHIKTCLENNHRLPSTYYSMCAMGKTVTWSHPQLFNCHIGALETTKFDVQLTSMCFLVESHS